ncbi:MAG TPA: TadE family protein [Pyrinomonadaceae bacterium]|nr:TadE family protein [Pyrinomonadaceae bacterium]
MCARIRKIRSIRRLRRRLTKLVRNDAGVQLLELAIVLPIFVILFGATAEFGRYFYEYTTLAKGARAGARYLVTAKVDCNQATIAKNLVVYGNTAGTGSPILPGLTVSNVAVSPNDLACSGTPQGVPETITVTITGFNHQSIFDLGGLLNNAAVSMNVAVKPSVTMRYLLSTPLV